MANLIEILGAVDIVLGDVDTLKSGTACERPGGRFFRFGYKIFASRTYNGKKEARPAAILSSLVDSIFMD